MELVNEFGEMAFPTGSQLEKDYEILMSEVLKLQAELLYCKTHMTKKYADSWRSLLPHVKHFWVEQAKEQK